MVSTTAIVYTINQIPPAATNTLVGTLAGGVPCLDCSTWPVNLALV